MSVYDLTGHKALVTGGARGLGEGMARALARAGAGVVIADIRQDLGKATAESPRRTGAAAEFVALDVTAEDSWSQARPQAIGHLGGLDILVNNAGIEITSLLVDIDPAYIRRMLEVNVLGTALGIKHGTRRAVHHRCRAAGRRRHGNVTEPAVTGKGSPGDRVASAWF